MLKPRGIGPESPWELMLPESLLNALKMTLGGMICLKSFLFLTHTLCVHRLYLYCVQLKTSQKALPKHTQCLFGPDPDHGKIQCVLPLQVLPLLTSPHAAFDCLLTGMGHLAF